MEVRLAIHWQSIERDIDRAVLVGPGRTYTLSSVIGVIVCLNDNVCEQIRFLVCHDVLLWWVELAGMKKERLQCGRIIPA